MSQQLPIGRKEDLHLEFKGGESLENPESIAREIVGLLNAEGGELWVGVREDQGVAVEAEGLDDPERARQRLRDTVVDLVEPAPSADELRIDVVGSENAALRIRATPQAERRPYELRRGGRLEFPIRFSDRLRPMTRQEREDAFASARGSRGSRQASSLSAAEKALLDDQEDALKSDDAIFWFGIEPVEAPPCLKLKRVLENGILEDPPLSDNRWYGITFQLAVHAVLLDAERMAPDFVQHQGRRWLRVGWKTPFELWIGETGALRSKVQLIEHPFSYPPNEKSRIPELREARSLNPKALLEYPASLFRLLRALHRNPEFWESPPRTNSWAAAVVLSNVESWVIEPGPDHPARRYPPAPYSMPLALQRRPQPFSNGPSFVGRVHPFTDRQVLDYPDGCAFRLMSQVFHDFGWSGDEIPYLDRTTAKLEF